MFFFGGNGNYPASANPWSATPTKVAPGYVFFTPGQAPAAQEFNYLFSSLSAAAGAGVTVPGASWRPISPVSVTGYTSFHSGAWDRVNSRWLLGAGASSGSGAVELFASQGLGDADYGVAVSSGGGIGIGGIMTSCAFDGTKYFAAIVKNSDKSLQVYSCAPGGAWAASINEITFVPYKDVFLYQPTPGSTLAGYMYAFGATGTAWVGFWTANSGTVWGGGAGGVGNILLANAGNGLLVADDGTKLVVFANVSGSSYLTGSQAGWTTRSTTFLTHGAEVPFGIVYSAPDALFVLITVGGDLRTHTYQSGDGISWLEVSSVATTVRGLAIDASGCLSAVTVDGSGNSKTIYSVDAGATWRQSQAYIVVPGFTALTYPRVYGGPTGFLALNSGAARFSHTSGLAPIMT